MLQIGALNISAQSPAIMGIINITPDSFFDGSRKQSEKEILESVEQQLKDGADIIDLGAYSSRPNALNISPEEEWERLAPALSSIRNTYADVLLSVDTFRASIAARAIEEGADIINDISGGTLDDEMFALIAEHNTPYILMHMRGNPQNMQQLNQYTNLIADVVAEIEHRHTLLKSMGANRIIIDPGFGFAKNVEQNFELLSSLDAFEKLDAPLLVGVSRKSMIYKSLNIDASEALNGTSVLNSVALLQGAAVLRVHDVKEAVEVRTLIKKLI